MSQHKKTSWKNERASVTVKGKSRPRSNKYSQSDDHPMPPPGTRQKIWVAGYTKRDGTAVVGHYRMADRT
jgi:hypothetical protein